MTNPSKERMTTTTIRALEILQENWGISPKRFAQLMWPESPAWKHSINCGPNGATSGRGMWLAAGSYLQKLRMRGLVDDWIDDYTCARRYEISHDGRAALAAKGAKK